MARYIKAVSPVKDKIDYMLVSHWHSDHCGEPQYSYKTSDGRLTSGLATVGEFFRIGTVFDHQYPECNKYGKGESHVVKMMYDYFERAKRRHGTAHVPFRVGALNQIALCHDKLGKYAKSFSVRNVCANGVVWKGCGDGVENLLADNVAHAGPRGFDENLLSMGVLVRYGKFSYFSGGDVCGELEDRNGKPYNFEARVGRSVGKVTLAKANHHAWKGTTDQGFVDAVRPTAFIVGVWDWEHIQESQAIRMIGDVKDNQTRRVFATFNPGRVISEGKGKKWLRHLEGSVGHLVVRVSSGGEYCIYVLDATTEERKVIALYK